MSYKLRVVDVLATQDSCIFATLVDMCGTVLTSDQIEKVRDKLKKEMREGNMSWAFDPVRINEKLKVDNAHQEKEKG